MSHRATLTLDREYMSKSFEQARRYGSPWRTVEWIIGVVFILTGIAFFIYVDWAALPFVLIVIGIIEIASGRIKKFFWLRKHAKSKVANTQVEIKFDDDGIETMSNFSSAKMIWSGVEKCVRTPDGILLWPQKGIYFYVPENVAGKDAIDFIESKVA